LAVSIGSLAGFYLTHRANAYGASSLKFSEDFARNYHIFGWFDDARIVVRSYNEWIKVLVIYRDPMPNCYRMRVPDQLIGPKHSKGIHPGERSCKFHSPVSQSLLSVCKDLDRVFFIVESEWR
jgi:hypothetical protein